jgi:hypothetical protein
MGFSGSRRSSRQERTRWSLLDFMLWPDFLLKNQTIA